MVQRFTTTSLVDINKAIFWRNLGRRWNSPKTFSLYWSFPKSYFAFCQKAKANHLSDWILIQGIRMPNLVEEYKTIFLGNRGKPWELFKYFYLILEFPINLLWSLSKAQMESSGPWNIGLTLYNAKFGQRIQNHFSGKVRQALEVFKNSLLILEFLINLFWSVWEISVDCDFCFFKFCECLMFNCEILNWR